MPGPFEIGNVQFPKELESYQYIIVKAFVLRALFIKLHLGNQAETGFSNRTFWPANYCRVFRHGSATQEPVLV